MTVGILARSASEEYLGPHQFSSLALRASVVDGHRHPLMLTQHDLQIRVRYQETDAMGRLHHANYLTYFELGRTELLRAAGYTYRQFEEQGLFLVVSEMTCRYLRPANYDDLLTLRTATLSARGARIEHEYQLFRGTELLATGKSTVACVDRNGNVKRLPDWMRISG